MNFKRLLVGVLIVVFLYSGNIIYFQMQQLSGPFFLDHYYDFELNRDGVGTVDLYYVTNKKEDIDIWSIAIPEVEFAVVKHDVVHQELTHYQVKRATVELNGINVTNELKFEMIDVQFSQQDRKQFSIGEIILRPSTYVETERPIEFLASGSSSNQMNFSLFETTENLQMKEINYSFQNLLDNQFEVYFDYNTDKLNGLKNKLQSNIDEDHEQMNQLMWQQNGIALDKIHFPIKFKKGDAVKVNSSFHFANNSPLKKSAFQFELRLIFETENGDEVIARDHINYQTYLSNNDVKKLREKVGGSNE